MVLQLQTGKSAYFDVADSTLAGSGELARVERNPPEIIIVIGGISQT